jgi:cytochrome P450
MTIHSVEKIARSVDEFDTFQTTFGAEAANRLLFAWLDNDATRKELLADMVKNKKPLFFMSNAACRRDDYRERDKPDLRDYDWIDGPRKYEQPAMLLAHPEHVQEALTCSNTLKPSVHDDDASIREKLKYSNSPYQGLGGYFMLAMDAPTEHDEQRDYAFKLLDSIKQYQYDALATLAFKAGALAPLKSHEFDLTAMAEDIAARYVLMVYGFAQKDLPLIKDCTRKIGRGLQYQIMGRHFVIEPATMIESRAALARLAQRAGEILHLYLPGVSLTRTEEDEKEEIDEDLRRLAKYEFYRSSKEPKVRSLAPPNFQPILQRIASAEELIDHKKPDAFSTTEKALIAACLMGGSVTNIQNSICLCIAEIFKADSLARIDIRKAAIDERAQYQDAYFDEKGSRIVDVIKDALRMNPPVVYVPRRTNYCFKLRTGGKHIPIAKDTLVLVALGGASASGLGKKMESSVAERIQFELKKVVPHNEIDSVNTEQCPFAKVFGGAPSTSISNGGGVKRSTYTHSCPGMAMAMNVVAYTVRQLLVLPSLAQKINPDSQPRIAYGLEKRWGVQSTYYPLSYQKEQLLVQTPLLTILPIKTPVDFHSQALRQVIANGAPFIEKVLQDSKMVHFATFVFLESDSKLALFTMYDGDFDTYIGHFAKEFGHLFDRFFSHVAVMPKMPIREHPFEFVQYLKQFLQAPAEGYYFSAYPETSTDRITQHFKRQFDFNQIRGG